MRELGPSSSSREAAASSATSHCQIGGREAELVRALRDPLLPDRPEVSTEDPLRLAVTDLPAVGQPHAELDEPVVEEGLPRFDRMCGTDRVAVVEERRQDVPPVICDETLAEAVGRRWRLLEVGVPRAERGPKHRRRAEPIPVRVAQRRQRLPRHPEREAEWSERPPVLHEVVWCPTTRTIASLDACQPGECGVLDVAAQQLVAPLSLEHHLDASLVRLLHDRPERHDRGREVRGVEMPGCAFEHRAPVVACGRNLLELDVGVPRACELCPTTLVLVDARVTRVEHGGEGRERTAAVEARRSAVEDRRRVQPTRKADPDGHVTPHADANGILQELREVVRWVDVGSASAWGGEPPERPQLGLDLLRGECPDGCLRDDADPFVEAPLGAMDPSEREELVQRPIVRRAELGVQVKQRLRLGGDRNPSPRRRPVERLDAEAVATEHGGLRPRVPDDEPPHPVESLDAARAKAEVRLEDYLGVGSRLELDAVRLQHLPELDVVVDLSVEDEDDARLAMNHRLVPAGARVQDGEPAASEPCLGRRPAAAIVGTAMAEGVECCLGDLVLDGELAPENRQ